MLLYNNNTYNNSKCKIISVNDFGEDVNLVPRASEKLRGNCVKCIVPVIQVNQCVTRLYLGRESLQQS